MCQGLLGIQEIDSIRACINAAKQKESFIQGDKAENSLWTQTLDCYLRFARIPKGFRQHSAGRGAPNGTRCPQPF